MRLGSGALARRLVAMAVICGLATICPRPAHAAMAYALSALRIENFKITGATLLDEPQGINPTNSATYTGSDDVESASLDPNHATNGPGSFVGENDFFLGGGLTGDGSRADSQATFNQAAPAGFNPAELIAEARRTPIGIADGHASAELSVAVRQTGADPLRIDFRAIVELLAQAEADSGERAFAEAGYVIDLQITSLDDRPITYLTWSRTEFFSPSWSAPEGGDVTNIVQPFHMQKKIRSSVIGPASHSVSFSDQGDFGISFNHLGQFEYRVIAKVETYASGVVLALPVPEPSSWILLALGLCGWAGWRGTHGGRARKTIG
jgi:hypothetical protein